LTAIYRAWLGSVYEYAGHYDQAVEEAKTSLQLTPDFVWGLFILGWAYSNLRKHTDAIATHRKLAELYPGWKWRLGETYAQAGQRNEARMVAAEVEGKPGNHVAWGLARLYAALGDVEQCFLWLEKACTERDSLMPWIGTEKVFAPLRSDPRFQNLVRRIGVQPLG
jgi:tetratricopeptide (TPR) repeat protein